MPVIKPTSIAAALLLSLSGAPFAASPALDDLMGNAAEPATFTVPLPAQPEPGGPVFQQQRLPPDNDAPGFEWPEENKDAAEDFILIGGAPALLKISAARSSELLYETGKCELAANTRYVIASKPGFESEYMTVALKEPLPGCALTKGYVLMEAVIASSAGGVSQLPRNVRAFLDTLAYAEGTGHNYNYMFTFRTFKSYADHPRQVICAGKLCSTAAGRYQFLSRTWDPLAADLGLKDFTPPSQDKAAVEIIRRAEAYTAVANSSNYNSFKQALSKLNDIWASLPGSPYGQPTHSTSDLWSHYKVFLAKYK